MPFISLRDLEINIGVQQVQALALKPGEFEAAERAAAIRIVELAGVEEPETAADAPEWIRQPAAYLTFNALVPRMRSPELITWAAERARAAEAQLKGRRGSTRSSGSGASVGEIKHIPHW